MRLVLAGALGVVIGIAGFVLNIYVTEWGEMKSAVYLLAGMFLGSGGTLLVMALVIQAFDQGRRH